MNSRAVKLRVLIRVGCVLFSTAVAADSDGQTSTNLGQILPGQPSLPSDPYLIPVQSISDLTRELEATNGDAQVHVRGTVLDQRLGEYIVVRDDTGTLSAETRRMVAVKAREQVDVLGTPVWDGMSLHFKDATFRSVDAGTPTPAKAAAAPAKPADLPVLTKVRQIKELPPEHAAWQYPLRLRAVVTLYLRSYQKFYVQDETSGIYVRARVRADVPDLKSGDLVEITGESDPGGFAPVVVATNVTVVGAASLPEPCRPTPYQLAVGQYNCQWTEVRGVVRSLAYERGMAQLKLDDASGTFSVSVPAAAEPTNLVDAVVRIQGVSSAKFNARRQFTGVTTLSPSLDFVQVEEPGMADPFSLPARPIVSLSQFQPQETLPRRAKVVGVVTLCQPGKSFFLQDDSDAIQVFTSQKGEIKPGDRVLAAGYPAMGNFSRVLRDAVFQVQEHGTIPKPKSLLPGHTLDPDLDDYWVQLDAHLLSRSRSGGAEVLTLQFDGQDLEAHCLAPMENKAAPPVGSLLHLTGVYLVQPDEARQPKSFQILVPSAQQIRVLERPSWWTSQHSIMVVGAMAFIIAAIMLWVFLLHRQVAEQTRRLRERLEREAALEQRSREIFEGTSDVVFTHDMEGRFTSLNPAGERILGYSTEEAKQLTIYQVLAPEYHQEVKHVLDPQIAGQEVVTIEGEFVAKDGRRALVEASARLVLKEGKPAGVQGIARDITARKRAEAALAEASSLFETLLANSRDHIYFKDRESRFVRYSKSAFANLFHLSNSESLRGKTDFDFFSEEHARPAFEDEQEIIRTGQPLVGKLERETHADGRVTWALTTKMPWRDKDGNIIGTFGISKDVTAIKEAEDQLAHEQELLRTLLNNIPDAIYFKDRQSRFVRVSKSKMEMARKISIGRHRAAQPSDSPGELPAHLADAEQFAEYLPGKTDFDIYAEERARPAFEDEQEIMRTGQPVIGKTERTIHSDGKTTWVLTTKMPWLDKDGNLIGTFGISKDITAIKQAEAELEITHKRLLEVSRHAGMAEVATDVLHNVGNVLNSVNVSCSLAIDRVQQGDFANLAKIPQLLQENAGRLDEFLTADPKGKRIPEYLTAVAESLRDQKSFLLGELDQLRKHIDHIKQIVAMQQSYAKVAGTEETVEVGQLVEDALEMNAGALDRHTVQVRREIEPVPPIVMDKHKALQILVNLIRNAKYALSEADRRDKLMTVRVSRNGGNSVHLQVIDNGVGIPPENLTRIFAHGFTTRRDGHGFGLHSGALAARDLGGKLFAQSDGAGKGATFTLELPTKTSSNKK